MKLLLTWMGNSPFWPENQPYNNNQKYNEEYSHRNDTNQKLP